MKLKQQFIFPVLSWLFAAVAVVTGAGPAHADDTVALQRFRGMLLVPVSIDGADTRWFLLDTGASHSVIDKRLAEDLGLKRMGRSEARTLSDKVRIEIVMARSLSVGGRSADPTFMAVLDLSAIQYGEQEGVIAGLLGNDFLSRQPYTIDYSTAELILHDPASFRPPDGQAERVRRAGMNPTVKLNLPGGIEGWFVLDTGAERSLILTRAFASMNDDLIADRPWSRSFLLDAGGVRKARETYLEQVDGLGRAWSDVETDYFLSKDEGDRIHVAGNMGSHMLRGLRITLDPGAERVWVSGGLGDNGVTGGTDLAGITPLMRAAAHCDGAGFKAVLDQTKEIEATDAAGTTALLYAAWEGNLDAIKALVERGADLDHVVGGRNALYFAADGRHAEAVAYLIEKGASVNVKDVFNGTPLIRSVERGDLDIVKLLIEAGPELEVDSPAYGTALDAAAYHGRIEIARLLLNAGADPNNRGPNGQNLQPLDSAIYFGHTDMIRLLIDHGADPNGMPPPAKPRLIHAAERGHLEVVRILLDAGLDPHQTDDDSLTAFDWALRSGHTEVMRLLYEAESREAVKP